ncbi:uncharacterized protein LOC142333222 [Lycorma delicatula]|uniref:uncharacterized protein LOC142333222 n=1 Tax=Lycorma delicatula TaxID=130591 RepID=UPI003F518AD4
MTNSQQQDSARSEDLFDSSSDTDGYEEKTLLYLSQLETKKKELTTDTTIAYIDNKCKDFHHDNDNSDDNDDDCDDDDDDDNVDNDDDNNDNCDDDDDNSGDNNDDNDDDGDDVYDSIDDLMSDEENCDSDVYEKNVLQYLEKTLLNNSKIDLNSSTIVNSSTGASNCSSKGNTSIIIPTSTEEINSDLINNILSSKLLSSSDNDDDNSEENDDDNKRGDININVKIDGNLSNIYSHESFKPLDYCTIHDTPKDIVLSSSSASDSSEYTKQEDSCKENTVDKKELIISEEDCDSDNYEQSVIRYLSSTLNSNQNKNLSNISFNSTSSCVTSSLSLTKYNSDVSKDISSNLSNFIISPEQNFSCNDNDKEVIKISDRSCTTDDDFEITRVICNNNYLGESVCVDSVKKPSLLSSSPSSSSSSSSSSSDELVYIKSDIEDSDEYENMVINYLKKNYSYSKWHKKMDYQNLSSKTGDENNLKTNLVASYSSDNNDDDESCSDRDSSHYSDSSDFIPTQTNREKTLYKRHIWRLLELDMLKEIQEENNKSISNLKRTMKRSSSFVGKNNKNGHIKTNVSSRRRPYKNKINRNLLKLGLRNKSKIKGIEINDENVFNGYKNEIHLIEDNKLYINNEDNLLINGYSSSRRSNRRNDIFRNLHKAYIMKKYHISVNCNSDSDTDNNFDNDNKLPCDVCKIKFCNWTSLNGHMVKFHEGDITTICEKCGHSFCNSTDYKKHVSEFHNDDNNCDESTTACYICLNKCKSFNDFLDHLRETHIFFDLYTFKCDKCKIKFANEYMLKNHYLLNNCLFCYICKNYIAINVQRFKLHILHHFKIHKYKCKFCEKTFLTQRGCKNHIDTKHNSSVLPFHCDICDHRFITKNRLDEHNYRCHSVTVHECNECGKVYQSMYSLNMHKKLNHRDKFDNNEINNFICNFCDINFCRKQLIIEHLNENLCKCPWCNVISPCITKLEEHIVTHKLSKSDRYKCTHCNFDRIITLQHYKRHVLLSHPNIYLSLNFTNNAIICDRCNRICSSRHHLKKHQRSSCMVIVKNNNKKSNDYKFCEFCKTSFKTKSLLIKHFSNLLTTCFFCNLKFNCDTLLNNHMKEFHNDDKKVNLTERNDNLIFTDVHNNKSEKNNIINNNAADLYICHICQNKYRNRYLLNRHIQIVHSSRNKNNSKNIFKFHCLTCGNKYHTSAALKKHMKSCKEDKKLSCNNCNKLFVNETELELHIIICNNCLLCNNKFRCCNLFISHFHKFHNDDDERVIKFKCRKCDDLSSSIDFFIKHYSLKHNIIDKQDDCIVVIENKNSIIDNDCDKIVSHEKDSPISSRDINSVKKNNLQDKDNNVEIKNVQPPTSPVSSNNLSIINNDNNLPSLIRSNNNKDISLTEYHCSPHHYNDSFIVLDDSTTDCDNEDKLTVSKTDLENFSLIIETSNDD